jgi:hypothetical protein
MIEEAPVVSGLGYNIDKFILTPTDISNKYVTLAASPSIAAETTVDIPEGCQQKYGTDFTVSGSTLSWNGLGMEALLASGDELIVQYN